MFWGTTLKAFYSVFFDGGPNCCRRDGRPGGHCLAPGHYTNPSATGYHVAEGLTEGVIPDPANDGVGRSSCTWAICITCYYVNDLLTVT